MALVTVHLELLKNSVSVQALL